jgi:hypothetical protein
MTNVPPDRSEILFSKSSRFRKKRLQRIAGKALKNRTIARLLLKIARLMLKSTIFALWKQIDRKNRWGPKDLVDILQGEGENGVSNLIISVSKVVVTSDLSVATVHLSVFLRIKQKRF